MFLFGEGISLCEMAINQHFLSFPLVPLLAKQIQSTMPQRMVPSYNDGTIFKDKPPEMRDYGTLCNVSRRSVCAVKCLVLFNLLQYNTGNKLKESSQHGQLKYISVMCPQNSFYDIPISCGKADLQGGNNHCQLS